MIKDVTLNNANHPRRFMKTRLSVLLAAMTPLFAQAAGPVAPDAGSILQQIQPARAPAPSPAATGLSISNGGSAGQAAGVPFAVTAIQITGNTLFDGATLHALVADAEGKNLTLAQLGEVAARITAYYQQHDYPLMRAIVPAQTIAAGVVQIEVIEARYGQLRLDNGSRVGTPLLEATLAGLQSGQMVAQKDMDHVLLLMSDVLGVALTATLKPGATVGTSDLQVDVTPTDMVTGNVVADNYGNRYTGRARLAGTVNVGNPLHHGDLLSASVLTSGNGLGYGRVSYDTLLNGLGTHLGGSVSALHYELGNALSALDAHGNARVASLWLRHPFLRSRDANLYGQLQFDQVRLRDQIDTSALRTHRTLSNQTLLLTGDARDALFGAAVNTGSLSWTSGRVRFDDAAAEAADAATARTRGNFSKWTASASRLQGLTTDDALLLSGAAQWANGNLDSSEKMSIGGPASVRAYDVGTVSGDSGYRGSVEFQHRFGQRWQAIAFVDSAHVTINKNPWDSGINSAMLSGAGVGLNWRGEANMSVQTTLATTFGTKPVQLDGVGSTRAWVEFGKGF
ncbi:hemolysin activation/secretion protein [Actimicrobium sp. GrIS 1.19]|nr:hemolysin activation/secretion protein [Actimicrobium sp. GrIS 1.19]